MPDGKSKTFLTHLENIINNVNPSLILCVVQSTRNDVYNLIKRKLCIDRAGISYFCKRTYVYYCGI